MNKVTFVILLMTINACRQEQDTLQMSDYTGKNTLAYSDTEFIDNSTLITSRLDGRIYYESPDGEPELIIELREEIYDIEISPEQNLLFAASGKNRIVVVDLGTKKRLRNLPMEDRSVAVQFDPNTNVLAAAGSATGEIFLWDLSNQYELTTIQGGTRIYDVEFYDNGSKLATGGFYIDLWDLNEKKKIRRIAKHYKPVLDLEINEVNQTMISCGADKRAFLFDLTQENEDLLMKHPNWLLKYEYQGEIGVDTIPVSMIMTKSVMFEDKILTSGADHSVRLWSTDGSSIAKTLSGHESSVVGLAVSPNGSKAATVDLKGKLLFWDL